MLLGRGRTSVTVVAGGMGRLGGKRDCCEVMSVPVCVLACVL